MRHPKRRHRDKAVFRRRTCGVERECGGCPLLATPFREQMSTKTNTLRAALSAYPSLAASVIQPCVPAPSGYGYRVRAKLAVRRQREGARLGLFRRGSDHLIDLSTCLVHAPRVQQAIGPLRAWIDERRLAFPDGPLIMVDLRESAGDALHLTLVSDGRHARPARWDLEALRAAIPDLGGVALNLGDARSSYAMGPSTETLDGSPSLHVEVPGSRGPLRLEVAPGAFFQVNPAALPAVHERMAAHIGPCERLVDLYCGVGTHGLALAPLLGVRELLGIDEHPGAIESASRNAEGRRLAARYLAGRAEDLLATQPLPEGATGLVLNPGRPGCRPEVLEAMLAARPSRSAYLSCNPETLARDLDVLVRGGMKLSEVVPFDFMPQTDQVEALALLQ